MTGSHITSIAALCYIHWADTSAPYPVYRVLDRYGVLYGLLYGVLYGLLYGVRAVLLSLQLVISLELRMISNVI